MQQTQKRAFHHYEANVLNDWLGELGYDLSEAQPLAAEVLRLSNTYNEGKGSPNIWQDKGFLAAYLVYFHPLNFLRLQQVISDGAKVGFWENLTHLVDFGAGLGTLESALAPANLPSIQKISSYEPSRHAVEMQKLFRNINPVNFTVKTVGRASSLEMNSSTVVGFSYSLNEMAELPQVAENAEAVLFLEPSTLTAGRRLQELRAKLLNKGFYAWAPCLHQQTCPLLKHSQRDWCHTRLHVEMPNWFLNIEKYLPMKNQSITYSYLLMRKTPPQKYDSQEYRIIGDTLFEKGKVRQAICQNDKRLFFSWLTKWGEAPHLPRGARVHVDSSVSEKSDEVRPAEADFRFTLR